MLKQLIHLQIVKKRRNFKWKNLFLATYFYMLIALIIVSTFAEMDSRIWKTFVQLDWKNIVPIVASMMLLPDILSKLIFKTDSAIMDAYIKSRPISKRTWIYFISITNLFNFWTLAWALPLSIGCFFVMPFGTAFVSALLLLSVSYINSLAVVALRTSQGWEWKWATIVGWFMWWSLTFVHGLNLFGMSWGIHITLFFVLTVIGITTGIYYLQCLNSYDESKRKQETINKSHRSAFFIEMRPFLRGKRLRLILIFPVLLVAQAFWSASMGPDDGDASGSNLLLPLAIIAPSVMVLQLTFALEGNYFDGLWTRPVSIAHLLFRKYYTAIPLTIGSFLLLYQPIRSGGEPALCAGLCQCVYTHLLLPHQGNGHLCLGLYEYARHRFQCFELCNRLHRDDRTDAHGVVSSANGVRNRAQCPRSDRHRVAQTCHCVDSTPLRGKSLSPL